jgi:hypothetical protein
VKSVEMIPAATEAAGSTRNAAANEEGINGLSYK